MTEFLIRLGFLTTSFGPTNKMKIKSSIMGHMVFQKIEHNLDMMAKDGRRHTRTLGRSVAKELDFYSEHYPRVKTTNLRLDLHSDKVYSTSQPKENGRCYMNNRKILKGSSLTPPKLNLKVFNWNVLFGLTYTKSNPRQADVQPKALFLDEAIFSLMEAQTGNIAFRIAFHMLPTKYQKCI